LLYFPTLTLKAIPLDPFDFYTESKASSFGARENFSVLYQRSVSKVLLSMTNAWNHALGFLQAGMHALRTVLESQVKSGADSIKFLA
jgi:hypothetical protein